MTPEDDGFDRDIQDLLHREAGSDPAPYDEALAINNIGDYVINHAEVINSALQHYAECVKAISAKHWAEYARGSESPEVKAEQDASLVPHVAYGVAAVLSEQEAKRAADTAFGLAEVIREAL